MDFTANEGSGLNSTGGSNPPVSAFGPGPWTGAFCVPGPGSCSAADGGWSECAVRTTDAEGAVPGSVAGLAHGGTQQVTPVRGHPDGMESSPGTPGGGDLLHGVP